MEITKQELSIIEKAGKLGGEKPSNLISFLVKALPIIIIASIVVVIASSFIGVQAAQKHSLLILFGLAIAFGGIAMVRERTLLQLIKKQDQLIKKLEGRED